VGIVSELDRPAQAMARAAPSASLSNSWSLRGGLGNTVNENHNPSSLYVQYGTMCNRRHLYLPLKLWHQRCAWLLIRLSPER